MAWDHQWLLLFILQQRLQLPLRPIRLMHQLAHRPRLSNRQCPHSTNPQHVERLLSPLLQTSQRHEFLSISLDWGTNWRHITQHVSMCSQHDLWSKHTSWSALPCNSFFQQHCRSIPDHSHSWLYYQLSLEFYEPVWLPYFWLQTDWISVLLIFQPIQHISQQRRHLHPLEQHPKQSMCSHWPSYGRNRLHRRAHSLPKQLKYS